MTHYSITIPTRVRPKSRKARKKSIYRWLRERTSSVDYGFKYNGHPIHCNTNEQVLAAFNGGRWLSRMTNEKFDAHFSGEKTFYCTGNGSPICSETLLNIDIDCHKTGTLAGAIAFAKYLRDNYFPTLYFEVSTNGNGVHAYVVVEKGDLGSVFLNGLFRRFEQHLRQILSATNFDVEGVEVKGTCPVFVWGDQKGQLQNYKSGTLAKLPRESDRFEDLRSTTRLTYLDLLKLPVVERENPPLKPASGASNGRYSAAGSISGKVIGSEELAELKGHYLHVAETLMEVHSLKTTGRTVATAEDLGIFLMLLRFFTTHMNHDGSLPYARFKRMWESLHDAGDLERPFEDKRFAALRNYLSSLGLLDWEDESYTLSTVGWDGKRQKGKAARWRASDLLMSLLDRQKCDEQQEHGVGTTSEGERGEEVSLAGTQIRQVICSLSRHSSLDIRKPIFCLKEASWMISPEELAPYIGTFDDSLTVAA